MTQAEEHEALVEACAKAAGGEWPTARARAILAVIVERAKEWPTEEMIEAWHAQRQRVGHITVETGCRALLANSPLVKPASGTNQ